MAKKISQLTATTLQAGDEVEIYRPSAPTSDLRAPLDSGTVSAERIDPSTLLHGSVDLPFLSLFAFNQDDNMAPVLVQATTVGSGGGTTGGGFTTQIDPNPGVAFDIGAGLNGIHRLLDVAAAGTLLDEALLGTRVAITAASAGTTTVNREGGATYRIKGVDDPGDPGRTAAMTLTPAGYYEFEVIRNVGGAAAEWDVYGIPVGIATKLAGPVDGNSQEIYGNLSPWQNATGSQAAAPSGRSWKLTGNISALPITNGWHATYLNASGSSKTITPPTGAAFRAIELGTLLAANTAITVANNKMVVVHADGTNLIVSGDIA